MAGDNDLEDFAFTDLQELKKVGSTSKVDVFAQIDSMRDDHTLRYHVRKGTTVQDDVVMDLGETNTGDPKVAIDFFTWGMKQSPAKRYLMVIWNHGSGIDEEDIYRGASRFRGGARSAKLTIARRGTPGAGVVTQRRVRAALTSRFRRSLFSKTFAASLKAPRPNARAIAYDDSARDFLDNMELAKVLAAVKAKLKRKVDVLGFDACLMNMVEVAYQLRGSADFISGSEEVEPGDGWPYDRILADLAAKPTMSAAALGDTIVRRYAASYKSDAVTLSLLDLEKSKAVADAVDRLAGALIQALKDGEIAAITKAAKDAQRFDMKDFVDLGDLAAQLRKRCRSKAVKSAADAVTAALRGAFVATEKHSGTSVARASGVSIYCPLIVREAKLVYDRLAFAKDTRWNEFLAAYDKA
jgi:hypothetical protein